jgi:hypothetical protein
MSQVALRSLKSPEALTSRKPVVDCEAGSIVSTAVHLGLVIGLVVICSGFIAHRGFAWKRQRDAFTDHLEQKDLASRRHHFRGAVDVELISGPPDQEQALPPAVDPDGRDRA